MLFAGQIAFFLHRHNACCTKHGVPGSVLTYWIPCKNLYEYVSCTVNQASCTVCCKLRLVFAVVQITCKICYESYPVKSMHASMCDHYFCRECWEGYVANAISEGPAALNLRCPLPDCKAAVCLPLLKFPFYCIEGNASDCQPMDDAGDKMHVSAQCCQAIAMILLRQA